jgi:hypothetical protein
MNKVLYKHNWTCPKCGEKVKFADISNRDNAEFYFRLSLIIGASILLGSFITIGMLSLLSM